MSLPNPFPQTLTQKEFKAKKAGTNGSHVFLIVDESGSMSNLRTDTIGGINTLIKEQAKDDIHTNLTIIKFEGGDVKVPVSGFNVKEMKEFHDYKPSGSTNLLDAIGFAFERINDILGSLKKKERPSIFIQIITDGYENSSHKFTRQQIKNMVEKAESSDWVLSFVGANIDSFAESSSFGFNQNNTANYSANKTYDAYSTISTSLSRMKGMRSVGISASAIYSSGSVYTAEDRNDLE